MYGIRLGYRTIITEEKTEMIAEEEFQYPIHLENQMQTALCETAIEHLRKETDFFYQLYERDEMQSTVYQKNL